MQCDVFTNKGDGDKSHQCKRNGTFTIHYDSKDENGEWMKGVACWQHAMEIPWRTTRGVA